MEIAVGFLGVMGSIIIGTVMAGGTTMPPAMLWPRLTAVSVIALSIAAVVIWG